MKHAVTFMCATLCCIASQQLINRQQLEYRHPKDSGIKNDASTQDSRVIRFEADVISNNSVSSTNTGSTQQQAPRLRRFPSNEMNSFPKPTFISCTNHKLCTFKNVCFSKHDGMLVFETPELLKSSNATTNEDWYTQSNRGPFQHVTVARRPVSIPRNVYAELTNVYFANHMFVLSCWRQQQGRKNPAHMLMGTGKLFVASTGYYYAGDDSNYSAAQQHFDVVLHHHCTSTKDWAWAELVEKLILNEAFSNRMLSPSSSYLEYAAAANSSIYVPYQLPNKRIQGNQLRADDLVICGKTVYQEPFSTGTYLGANDADVVAKWQTVVDDFVNENMPAKKEEAANAPSSSSCKRNLRIAVWRRTEGSALRHLTNLDEIEHLVSEYSDRPLSIVTASSDTPPEDQVALFRSFDILITPHGSHLANMIFNPPNATVYIEVAAVYYNDIFEINGRAFAKDWISSFGHLPKNNAKLVDRMTVCSENRDSGLLSQCPQKLRLAFVQSDLTVNTTILRGDLERALSVLCPA